MNFLSFQQTHWDYIYYNPNNKHLIVVDEKNQKKFLSFVLDMITGNIKNHD